MNEIYQRGNVSVALRSAFTAHGEDIVKSRLSNFEEQRVKSSFVCPEPVDHSNDWHDQQTLVATVDGVVAGRVVLETVAYPFAELVNLVVMPAFRRCGVGSELVRDAIRRTAELGFPIIHLQTSLEAHEAHRLYTNSGFVPANQGEMLRMFRLIDIPALAQFQSEHPLAIFSSERAKDSVVPQWNLEWTDPIQNSSLCMGFTRGSCQSDSGGFGPGLEVVTLNTAGVYIKSTISGPSSTNVGDTFNIALGFTNSGDEATRVACRLILNQGVAPADDKQGVAAIEVAPGDTTNVMLSAKAYDSFTTGLWGWRSFPSIPVAVEVFVGDYVFLLCHQLKVKTEQ